MPFCSLCLCCRWRFLDVPSFNLLDFLVWLAFLWILPWASSCGPRTVAPSIGLGVLCSRRTCVLFFPRRLGLLCTDGCQAVMGCLVERTLCLVTSRYAHWLCLVLFASLCFNDYCFVADVLAGRAPCLVAVAAVLLFLKRLFFLASL